MLALLLAVLLFSSLGCGTGRRSEPVLGPLSLDTAERRGQIAFFRHCHQCHPTGGAGLGPSLNDKPVPDAAIRLQVRNGLGAMPSFSERELPEHELDDLLRYVRALRSWD